MKKSVSLFLILCLLVSLCACGRPAQSEHSALPSETQTPEPSASAEPSGEPSQEPEPSPEPPVLISAALDPADCEPERSIKTFQDIASFLGRRIDKWQETYRELKVTEVEGDAIVEYVRLLIDEFDYEIVGGSNFDPDAGDPFNGKFEKGSWEVLLALSTVDTGRETKGRIDSNVSCDIRLHCDAKGKLTLVFTDLFHTEDYGYRWSGSEGDRFNEVYGQRALDAYYLENGRYRNGSDGVLSVEAGTHGEAVILIDGEEVLYSTDASVYVETYVDYPKDDYVVRIYDFMDGVDAEMIEVNVPKTLMGGEIYTLSDALESRGDSPISIYGQLEGNGWASSSENPTARNATKACTLRVLQWDETECVVYIAMDIVYELEPRTIEILAAMPAYGSLWGETFKESEAVTLKVGESLELKYDGPYVFMPNYETYEWKLSSGQGAAITGYGDTCTVTAVAPGQIIIRCVYSYGKDEPDVLTGIPRNENHTKTELYYINIVQ